MGFYKIKWVLLILIINISVLFSYPPPVPSAGVIERQLEKEYEAKPIDPNKDVPDIQIDIPDERLEMEEGLKVYVCKVKFIGNEAIVNILMHFHSEIALFKINIELLYRSQ